MEIPFSQGSGFFFKPNLIATSLHVLRRASEASVELLATGKKHQILQVVGVDVRHDICVLRIETGTSPALSLSSSGNPHVGDEIYVAGNPEGLKGSFSKGIISAIRKDQSLIQIDASISPGSSGGPVVNDKGQVIGIAEGGLTGGQHLNFAVPVRFLSFLPLTLHLPVNAAGEMAVSFRDKEKLQGPVHTVLISQAWYSYFDKTNGCIQKTPTPTRKSIFDGDGFVTESMSYNAKGETFSHFIYEYDERGFRIRESLINLDGSRKETRLSQKEWIQRISDYVNLGDTTNLDDGTVIKYDRDRNPIEMSYTTDQGRNSVAYDYREDGIVIGEKINLNGRLDFSYRYTYQFDDYGNWVKQVKLRSDSAVSDECPSQVVYRQITYSPQF